MTKVLQIFLISFFVILAFDAYSQYGEISGKISDEGTKNPLTGANISLIGTHYGTASDFNGNYNLQKIPAGNYTLTISFIGFESVSEKISLKAGEIATLNFLIKAKAYQADQAVVTGNRVRVSRNVSPLAFTIVDRQAISESGESNVLPVVASHTPGMFVTERGMTGFGVSDGSAGKITIRGIGGSPNNRVLVLIDGHPQFMGIFGHPLPDAYIASDAEKVEVIRGPASILYGSNAMGGVLNIITRQQHREGLSASANIAAGSFNTWKYAANAGYKHKRFEVFASFNHDQTDGQRANSDFKINNGYLKTSYEISPNIKVLADISLAGYKSTDPGPVYTEDTTYHTNPHWQDILRAYGSVSAENDFGKVSGALKFYYNWGEHKLFDGFHSKDRNFGFMFYQGLKLFPGNIITIGIDYVKYGGFAENINPAPPMKFVDTTLTEKGAYILVQQQILKKLYATAGLRLQDNQSYGSEWVPESGLSYEISGNSVLKANVAKGFRSPTIQELFLFKAANPDLKPENMWNYEITFIQKFLKGKLSFEITPYYSVGNNLIETSGYYPDISNKNIGNFENYGIEFQGKYIISEKLNLNTNYSYLHTDKVIISAPEQQFFVEANYCWKGFRFNTNVEYTGNLYSQTEPAVKQSYTLINARVAYVFKKYLTLYINGQNLSDKKYAINFGYPMPGINLLGGLSLRLKN